MAIKRGPLTVILAGAFVCGALLAASVPASAQEIKEAVWARLDASGKMVSCEGRFRRGEKAHLILRQAGPFKAGPDGRCWFDLDMLVTGPGGQVVLEQKDLLGENGHVILPGAVAESPYGIFETSVAMEPGDYKMTLTLRDKVAGTAVPVVRPFTLSSGLSYGDAIFARMDDQNRLNPVESPVFRKGEDVHFVLLNVGLFKKGADGQHAFDIDMDVKDPTGRSILVRKDMLGENGHLLLENDIAGSPYVTFQSTSALPAGAYSMQMTIRDRIGNGSVTVKKTFELISDRAENPPTKEIPKESISLGTGFLVSEDGYVLTAAHVVNNAKNISISIDDTPRKAKLVKIDTTNDVAILKIAGSFSPVILGDAKEAKLGDDVFTVGFPNIAVQGVSPKLTQGVISSLNGIRDDPTSFQISTPIQPGNSGGPLVLKNGNVVGIVVSTLSASAALSSTGQLPQNVNYAVKINYAIFLMDSLGIKTKSRPAAGTENTIDSIIQAVVIIECRK
jgi:S1-C subfamily serine protease